ncbi:MAG: glycosyltransferase [Candidatus Delongbacteria bacterium]|jgi:glycosyltransferase involved in cell wall biosynthesis|nr:glycosyltransferase [Candidatus Delongbacteria bacterium]
MNSEKTPAISVIMSVYNSEQYLQESVDSILDQTFNDFEFIVTDDCSTDGSFEIIKSYAKKDKRIKYFRNAENIGLTKSLNLMLDIAKGKYIARMDSDDISMPERFSKQFDFMENNPEIGVLGTNIRFFGNYNADSDLPTSNNDLKGELIFRDIIMHPTVMIRRSVMDENNLRYDEDFRISQDYDLWSRMISFTEFANMPEILLKYRFVDSNLTNSTKTEYRESFLKKIFIAQLKRLGINPSDEDICFHIILASKKKISKIDDLSGIKLWLEKIAEKNKEKLFYDQAVIGRVLSKYWFSACTNSTGFGLKTYFIYKNFQYVNQFDPGLILKFRFLLKCMVAYERK